MREVPITQGQIALIDGRKKTSEMLNNPWGPPQEPEQPIRIKSEINRDSLILLELREIKALLMQIRDRM